jgi:peptidoglycan/xylan/chitin deacetylase (PgdA/CDA1 family)
LTFALRRLEDAYWPGGTAVDIDTDKVDDAVLGLLFLTLHNGVRAWKGHDWDALDRLYHKGLIDNPVGKAKSVVLTDEGLAQSERLFKQLFARASG